MTSPYGALSDELEGRKPTKAQESVFEHLSSHVGITCYEAIRAGANGRTLDAMRKRGWLVERYYPNGPRVWELTNDGVIRLRSLQTGHTP